MKLSSVFIIVFSLIFFSCKHSSTKAGQSGRTKPDSIQQAKKDTSNQVKANLEDRDIIDSIYKKKMLEFALAYANKNKDKESFAYKSQDRTIDSGCLSIDYGHLFDLNFKHLIIRIPPIDTPYSHLDEPIFIFLYVLKENHFVLLCSQKDSTGGEFGEYQGDTLQDVNGDGYKDFVVNWYGGCGCCPRADKHIFFYKDKDGGVENEFDLLNATFIADKKMVYLMDYGFPAQIYLYKCKWNGLKLDTLESVFADTSSRRNTFYVENGITRKGKTVHGIPKEYQCIDKADLDWFSSAWDK